MKQTMEKHCDKCHSNEIDELVWLNQVTGDITMREDQYYCHQCRAKVGIILAAKKLSWIEDIEPLEEETNNTPIAENENVSTKTKARS